MPGETEQESCCVVKPQQSNDFTASGFRLPNPNSLTVTLFSTSVGEALALYVAGYSQRRISAAAGTPVTSTTMTAPPASPAPSDEFPVATAIVIAGGVILVIAGGLLIRRWWIRRQNPVLFRDMD